MSTRPERRQIHELYRRILRELAREPLGEGSRLRQITCEGECECRGIVTSRPSLPSSSALVALCLAAVAFP